MPKPSDNYNPVPTVEPSQIAAPTFSVRATGENFGAQIGNAEQEAGKDIGSIAPVADQFAKTVTEAKVQDDYANKYAPAAADLRSQFDSLRGQDKVAGYQTYVKGLQDLNTQFKANQPNMYGQNLMGGLIDRHISGEISGAQRELVSSQHEFSDQATYDAIKADQGYATNNYNNPSIAGPDGQVAKTNDARILIQHLDAGHDPDSPAIDQAQNAARANQASGMIKQAVAAGDVTTANKIRQDFSPYMPGYQKIQADAVLHTANMDQTGSSGAKALLAGNPIPEAIGAPPAQVQSVVANTAHVSGIDPNAALTVLRIESSNGQNLGTRGTIGQDKASAGKPIEDQAKALCDNLKTGTAQATQALGRPAQPWEGYAVYQQGAGGGSALLKADPNAKAIDVLSPLYKSPKDAVSALTGNGGNATMSVSDFLQHIKQVYTQNEGFAKCDFGTQAPAATPTAPAQRDASFMPPQDQVAAPAQTATPDQKLPGDQILAPHQESGTAVQPAATPRQALLNFDSKAPDMLDRINSIPNLEVRDGVMKAYQRERNVYQAASTAYTTKLVNDAAELANKPDFTDMRQVPTEMQAALAQDSPAAVHMLQERAEYNLNHGGGAATKDMVEYGKGFKDVQNSIWNGQIRTVNQLHDAYNNGELTYSGLEKMTDVLTKPKDPASLANSKLEEQTFKTVRGMFLGKAETLGLPDPDGEATYGHAMALMYKAIDDGRQKGIPDSQLFDPEDKNWVGKIAQPLVKTAEQKAAEIGKPDFNTPDGLRWQVKNGKMTPEEGRAEAIKRGYILAQQAPQVPLAGQE